MNKNVKDDKCLNCDQSKLEGYDTCILHTPFPDNPESEEYKDLIEKKDKTTKNKIKALDFDFAGAWLYSIDIRKKNIEKANFSRCVFVNRADFIECIFKNDANFKKAKFQHTAYFNGSTFENSAIFKIGEFNTTSFCNVNFKNKGNFRNCTFKSLLFFEKIRASRSIIFDDSKFYERQTFFSAIKVEDKLTFYNTIFLNKDDKTNQRSKIYLCQKAVRFCSDAGYRKEADNHYFMEMQARRKLKPKKYQVFDFLIELLTGYGTKWVNAVWFWIIFVISSAIIYQLLPIVNYQSGIFSSGDNPYIILNFWKLLYFSIVTITTLGFGDLHPEGIACVFASIEAIVGTFIWALLILVIGRKYMR